MRREPGIVRHREDGLRAQPGAVDGQSGIHIVAADQRQHRDLAAIGQLQREHAGAAAGAPGARPGQPAPQHGPVQPRGQGLGEREQARLAVAAQPPGGWRHEGGGVVFARGIAVIGPEHERHTRRADDGEDLLVQLGAHIVLGLAEGGGIHRLGPQDRVDVLSLDSVVGHGVVGVEHLPHHGTRAAFGAQALVVVNVRLNRPHAQRPGRLRGGRWQRGQRRPAVGGQQQRAGQGNGQRRRHGAPPAACGGPARPPSLHCSTAGPPSAPWHRPGQPLVAEVGRDTGHAPACRPAAAE